MCKLPGHFAHDCPRGAQKQTIAKPNTNPQKIKDSAATKACVICGKSNHSTDYCFTLRKVKKYLSKREDKLPKLVSALENPFAEELEPLRDELTREINWTKCEIDETEIPEAITAVLQMDELWDNQDNSFEE